MKIQENIKQNLISNYLKIKGWALDSVTCVMHNNEDSTDTDVTVTDGVINISNVTGNIVITATATHSQP